METCTEADIDVFLSSRAVDAKAIYMDIHTPCILYIYIYIYIYIYGCVCVCAWS